MLLLFMAPSWRVADHMCAAPRCATACHAVHAAQEIKLDAALSELQARVEAGGAVTMEDYQVGAAGCVSYDLLCRLFSL